MSISLFLSLVIPETYFAKELQNNDTILFLFVTLIFVTDKC